MSDAGREPRDSSISLRGVRGSLSRLTSVLRGITSGLFRGEAGVFLMLEDHPMCHLSPPHRFSAYFQTRIETVGEGWGDTAALAICRAALVVPADGPR